MSAFSHASVPGPLASSRAATLTLLAPLGRFSLRVSAANAPVLAQAIGVDLPSKVGHRGRADDIEALCLGPDEWQILCDEATVTRIGEACARVYREAPHSLTDISDREISVQIEGPKAMELLTLGCPRDIERIGENAGCRTLMDGATVVLWRDATHRFRLDVWRSFAPHVIALLETGCDELAAE